MAENFTPGETISVSGNEQGNSASFTLSQSANYPDCLVTNSGNVTAFIGFGGANLPGLGVVNATPIMPGEQITLKKGVGVTQCSAIASAGNTLVYFTAGQGS